MSTYLNGFEILRQVRMAIDEYDDDIAQGIDTGTAIPNDYIMQKVNDAQRYIYNRLFKTMPDEFLTSDTLTFSGSEASLPWDYGAMHELRDENGYKVYRIKMNQTVSTNQTGSDSYYYQKGRTLVLDKSGVGKDYTIQYYTKPRDMDQGRITATGTLTITLDSSAKKVVDYYNNIQIENSYNSSDYVDTITDYTADRVATVTESAKIDDTYGTVSELPEYFHFLIPLKAIIDICAGHPLSKKVVAAVDIALFSEQFTEAIISYGGNNDIPLDEILCDYIPYMNSAPVTVFN